MCAVRRALLWHQPAPRETDFRFTVDSSAAEHNLSILEDFDLDLQRAIHAVGGTTLQPGSEFKPSDILESIFAPHPLWGSMKETLDNGIFYPLTDISEEERMNDLDEALTRGNHKSARDKPATLQHLIEADVSQGFALPLPVHCTRRIPGVILAPLGIAEQATIQPDGQIVPKDRLTHDQSFQYGSNKSVNSRVIKELLQVVVYSHCLPRLLHQIIDYRLRHPGIPILIVKGDYKSAFRRGHLQIAEGLASSCQVTDEIILISLRMTFGGAPNPSRWGDISEPACDLVNELLRSEEWSPEEFEPFIPIEIPKAAYLPKDIPFAQAKPLSVHIPPSDVGKCDVFIDDKIGITPDLGNNVRRLATIIPLVICLLARPLHKDEPILRTALLSLSKHMAEGRPEEQKVILGWLVDTRRLLVSLPEHKLIAWSGTIDRILVDCRCSVKELETLIGRLNHISVILRPSIHFLGRLRFLLARFMTKNKNYRKYRHVLSSAVVDDLHLWKKFLQHAAAGVSINNIVYRTPTLTFRSDACPSGMGGICFESGRAWRFQLPHEYVDSLPVNFMEFLAACISIRVEPNIPPECCFVSQTDNTNTEGWLKKSNFHDKNKSNMELARWLGHFLTSNRICNYSQYWPGEQNEIADSLSRDHHLTDHQLTALLRYHFPTQLPNNFRIVPLQPDVVSWIFSLVPLRPAKKPSPGPLTTSKIARSTVGISLSTGTNLATTPSSKPLTVTNESSSLEPSASQSASEPTPKDEEKTTLSFPAPPKKLSRRWLRPLGMLAIETPDSTSSETSANFYLDSIEDTKTTTHPPSTKKRSQPPSSAKCTSLPAPPRKKPSPNSPSQHTSLRCDPAST